MLGLGHELRNHGLNNTNIAIQQATKGASDEGNPDVRGQAHSDQAENRADAAQQQYRLASYSVGNSAPVHAHERLGQREARDEQAGIEGCILLVAHVKALDQCPGVWED